MALALLTALCLRKISRGRQLLSLCLLLPLVVPSGTGAYFWKILFDQNGLLIRTLVLFGVPHESLIQLNGRMAILVFVFLWKTVSYNTILFWSGLNWIPKTYYEQMALEGGGHLAQFRQVTWIYLAPTTFVAFLMSVVNAFKVFKEIYMLFGAYPGPDIYMLQHYMNNLFAALNLPRLSRHCVHSIRVHRRSAARGVPFAKARFGRAGIGGEHEKIFYSFLHIFGFTRRCSDISGAVCHFQLIYEQCGDHQSVFGGDFARKRSGFRFARCAFCACGTSPPNGSIWGSTASCF